MGRRKGAADRINGPPADQPWVWLSRDLLASKAWRDRSPNCARFIDFLLAEHAAHAGNENGNLQATYDQLVDYGIGRRLISAAIREAEALGLVAVKRGGKKPFVQAHTSRYRLTFYAVRRRDERGFFAWDAATDDWRKLGAVPKRAPKKQLSSARR